MMKIKRLYILVISLIILCGYLFWGPLFPWSPIKPGFQRIASTGAKIFIQHMTESDSIVYFIDSILEEEEEFHDLNYSDKITIIIVDPNTKMKRFVPWLKGKGYSVSLSLLNLIYIGPNARVSSFGIESYLKHELSHMLIDQNASSTNSMTMHDQGWLVEGVAQYFSGHQFYSRSDFIERCKRYNIHFPDLMEQNPLEMSVQDLPMKYTYYKLFIEMLVNQYGIDMFQKFLKVYMAEPVNYNQLFVEVYGFEPATIIDSLNSSLHNL